MRRELSLLFLRCKACQHRSEEMANPFGDAFSEQKHITI